MNNPADTVTRLLTVAVVLVLALAVASVYLEDKEQISTVPNSTELILDPVVLCNTEEDARAYFIFPAEPSDCEPSQGQLTVRVISSSLVRTDEDRLGILYVLDILDQEYPDQADQRKYRIVTVE